MDAVDEAEGVGSVALTVCRLGGCGGCVCEQPSIRAKKLKPSGKQMHGSYNTCMIECENTGQD